MVHKIRKAKAKGPPYHFLSRDDSVGFISSKFIRPAISVGWRVGDCMKMGPYSKGRAIGLVFFKHHF